MKLALKHVLTAIVLILSLAAPVAAGPHEDARASTGYRPGFDPYSGAPAPLPPPGVDAYAIDKNGQPIPFKYDPATGQRIGAQPATQDPAALSAKAQEILDAQTAAAPKTQPPAPTPRLSGRFQTPPNAPTGPVISAQAPAPAPAPAAAAPPTTGYTGSFVSPNDPYKQYVPNRYEQPGRPSPDAAAAAAAIVAQPRTGYNAGTLPPQQQAEQYQGLTSMELYNIRKQAYDAFPYDNQRTQRGNYEKQLVGQALRDIARRESNVYRDTPQQKMDREAFKQSHVDARAKMASEDKQFQIQTSRDNAWLRAVQTQMTAAQRNAVQELIKRREDFHKIPGNLNKTFEPTDDDKALMQEIYKAALNRGGINFQSSQTPGPGNVQQNAPAPAAPAASAPAPSVGTTACQRYPNLC